MSYLSGKNIVLGITGSIAAYKSAELVRELREAGAEVRVVMTEAATSFITPLTMQALSGKPVHTRLVDDEAEAVMGHIQLARWADLIVVAPASADFLARLVQGRANDLLAALCLATSAPLAVVPAMNTGMWEHPATQDNVARLRQRGVRLLGPAEGDLACGEYGTGRMLETGLVLQQLGDSFDTGQLSGCRVVVTAGPTREPIDPVRYISNRSSGKMGYAVAQAAAEAGADVLLISGPVALTAPQGVKRILVESAGDMQEAVMADIDGCDLFVAAAAVADYTIDRPAVQKLKKRARDLQIALKRTPDILAGVAALPDGPFTVGFAAETEDLEVNARKKRLSKSLDLVAANLVGQPGTGFDADENRLHVFWEGGSRLLPTAPKQRLARELVRLIADHYHNRRNARETHAKDSA